METNSKNIFNAVLENNFCKVEELLATDIDINSKNEFGNTIVHLLSMSGNDDLLKLILTYHPDLEIINDDGAIPLQVAVEWEHEKIVHLLLDRGSLVPDSMLKNSFFNEILKNVELDFMGVSDIVDDFFSVSDKLLESSANDCKIQLNKESVVTKENESGQIIVKDLKTKGTNSVEKNDKDTDLLSNQTITWNERGMDIVEKILVILPDDYVSKIKSKNDSPYILSPDYLERLKGMLDEEYFQIKTKSSEIDKGIVSIADKLLAFIIDEQMNNDDEKAEELSLRLRNFLWKNLPQSMIISSDKGRALGDDSSKEFRSLPPIMKAIYENNLEEVKLLIDKGVSVEKRDVKGNTCLMIAMACKANDIGKYLILKGARTNIKNSNGKTALSCAVYANNPEGVELVIGAGENINLRFKEGTFLVIAVRKNYPAVIQKLLDFGADLDKTDVYGKNALNYAKEVGNSEVITLLEAVKNSPTRVVKKKKRVYY